jgi:hypothetical protein
MFRAPSSRLVSGAKLGDHEGRRSAIFIIDGLRRRGLLACGGMRLGSFARIAGWIFCIASIPQACAWAGGLLVDGPNAQNQFTPASGITKAIY